MPPGMIPQPRFTTLQFQENQRRAESGAEESKATELPWGPWRCTHGTDRGFVAARPGGRAAQQPTTAGAGAAGQSRPRSPQSADLAAVRAGRLGGAVHYVTIRALTITQAPLSVHGTRGYTRMA